jgi:alkylation response protein AidB-like acyl-CoA dehydrogenase
MNDAGSWELPEELRMLRDTIRRFMAEEVKPVEDKLPHDAYTPEAADLERLQKKARDLGLWCFETPAEHGGAGLSLLGQCVAAEEAAKCRMGAYIAGCGAFGFDPPVVVWKGTEHQQRFAREDMEKGTKAFVAISEPSGGSDPGRAIQTRAERKSDRYVINGTKIWISGAGMAKWGIVFARVGESKGRDGITSFIVDKSKQGHQPVQDPGHPLLRAVRGALRQLRSADRRTVWATKARASHLPRMAGPCPPALCGRHHRHRAGGARARHRVGHPARGIWLAHWPTSRRSSG